MGCFIANKERRRVFEPHLHITRAGCRQLIRPRMLPDPVAIATAKKEDFRTLSAPPSFQSRDYDIANNEPRVLSAPPDLQSISNNAQAKKTQNGLYCRKVSRPLPLPVPPEFSSRSCFSSRDLDWSSHDGGGGLRSLSVGAACFGSQKSVTSSDGARPKCTRTLRVFQFEELAAGCENFSSRYLVGMQGSGPMYRCRINDEFGAPGKKIEIAVARVSGIVFQDWILEVESLSKLRHPQLCRLVGYSFEEGKQKQNGQLLVYEQLHNGGLDKLLYGRVGKRPLDWSQRMKIALDAARGLAYLHEQVASQVMFWDLRSFNIQVNEHFNAKLTGYMYSIRPMAVRSYLSLNAPYAAPETTLQGRLLAKSNVWSFGIVLLEILTGHPDMNHILPTVEEDRLQWFRQLQKDDIKLFLVIDPELKGHYSAKAARRLADLSCQCLQSDPDKRPSMKQVVEMIELMLDEECKGKRERLFPSKPRSLKEMLHEPSPVSSPSGHVSKVRVTCGSSLRSFKASPMLTSPSCLSS